MAIVHETGLSDGTRGESKRRRFLSSSILGQSRRNGVEEVFCSVLAANQGMVS